MYVPVVTAVDEFPSSPTIITLSADIIASADPTCSDDEKTSLAAQATAIDEAIATVEAALEAVQDDLTTATGTTASASALSEAAAAAEATTPAAADSSSAAADASPTMAAGASPTVAASASATGSTASGRFRAFRGIY